MRQIMQRTKPQHRSIGQPRHKVHKSNVTWKGCLLKGFILWLDIGVKMTAGKLTSSTGAFCSSYLFMPCTLAYTLLGKTCFPSSSHWLNFHYELYACDGPSHFSIAFGWRHMSANPKAALWLHNAFHLHVPTWTTIAMLWKWFSGEEILTLNSLISWRIHRSVLEIGR